jgi:hypothetical protein
MLSFPSQIIRLKWFMVEAFMPDSMFEVLDGPGSNMVSNFFLNLNETIFKHIVDDPDGLYRISTACLDLGWH